MVQLNPYLKFNDNCREAMNFYKDILGWELSLQTGGESPVGAQMPAPKDSILHSALTKDSQVIMGSDLHWGEELSNGNGNQICVNCESEKEITDFFTKLSDGGKITQPLGDMPWGSKFGSLIDKYEKYWIFNYDKSPGE